jgi:DNA-binding transcriptional ArsR family regulator
MTDEGLRVLHPTGHQLQVLAHPLRSRLLGALRFHGPATSTTLALRLGTNSGATSYHLRQLAEAGLVEDDAERSTRRDRYWRAAHDATSWRTADFEDDPDARAADEWLLRHHVHTTTGWVHQWLEERADWSPEWRDAADQSDYHLDLTPDGLEALMAELHEVMGRHRDAAGEPGNGTERVTVVLQGFPSPERRP